MSEKPTELEKLEKENRELRERVAFLERGKDVVERAEEYRVLYAQYETQVKRLTEALERERMLHRTHLTNRLISNDGA